MSGSSETIRVRGRSLRQLREEGDSESIGVAMAMAKMEATLEEERDRVRRFLAQDHLE